MPLLLKKTDKTAKRFSAKSLIRDPKTRLTQRLCRRLRCDVPLRTTQQLKPNHKLPNTRRPQQWRIEVCMKLPLWMLLSIVGRRMQPHRIRKRGIKNLIVRCSDRPQDRSKIRPFSLREVLEPSHVPAWQNHHLKRPHRPERNHSNKVRILRHHTL